MTVRTRVAPSPTGDPHVGTAYQALFSLAWARRHGGRFVLRIEDTDRERSTARSEQAIIDSLQWLGLQWDEGPGVGGPHGPYRQSERLHIYHEHANRLLAHGAAYRCFCTKDRLDAMRASRRQGAGSGYDRACRDIPRDQSDLMAQSMPFVIRMKAPLEGDCDFDDLLRGRITRAWSTVDDQVLIKSDGYPTYHLAVVVDDHLMGITHIIRGEEWINSVPKHVHLFGLFGWEPPVFCHLPLLRNPDRSKLSKRRNPTSLTYYRRAGYLPEALLNYLALMGWSMPGGEDKFTLEQMTRSLELEDITLGGPVFDIQKLRWLNARYIREDLTPDALYERLQSWALNDGYMRRVAAVARTRMETLSDWGRMTAFLFADEVGPDPGALVLKGRTPGESRDVLQFALWKLEAMQGATPEAVEEMFRTLADGLDIKLRDLTRPFYMAVSGSTSSLPLYDSIAILGTDLARMRLRRAIDALGPQPQTLLDDARRRYDDLFACRDSEPEEDADR